jgi:hypothetical protein
MAKRKHPDNIRKRTRLSMLGNNFEIETSYTQGEIIETLSELSADIDTYEFLGELFFEFLANEVCTTHLRSSGLTHI